jgi:uncharacterized protein YjbI with pentapeptide repeats
MLRSVAVFAVVASGAVGLAGVGAATAVTSNPGCPVLQSNGSLTTMPQPGDNWSDCDLQGADLYDANLSNINLAGANLQGAEFINTSGTVVDFAGANLSGANLDGATFQYVNLTGADLASATATGTAVLFRLTDADLTGANISNIDFSYAMFTRIKSGNLVTSGGTPVPPPGWALDNGYLMGPSVDFSQDDFPALGANVPTLTNRDLPGSKFSSANLTGMNLSGDNLAGAAFANADLTQANLNGDNLTGADFEFANLTGATLSGADLTGVMWSGNAICPDGTMSGAHSSTCANNIDDRAPVAKPAVSGTVADGWYRKVTVNWNWTDSNGTIDPGSCVTVTKSSVQGKPVTLTATCGNTAGAVGHASVAMNIENKGPVVTVTGVRAGRLYAAGHVPAAGCRTADALSGVARAATGTVTSSGWAHGVGAFTATCAGAANRAGIAQAAPVRVKYTVAYGLSGFVNPKSKATVARSLGKLPVSFKLSGLIPSSAVKFAAAADVRVTLSGPGISPVTMAAAWQPKSGTFGVRLPIPGRIKAGQSYQLTVRENVGTGWLAAPVLGIALNPETIRFT